MQFPLIPERNESGLVNQSMLLQRMREYAKEVASTKTHFEDEEYNEIDQALELIDMAAKRSHLGVDRRRSAGMSSLMAGARLEKNVDNLKTEAKIRMPEIDHFAASPEMEEERKEARKMKRAELKLRKLFDTQEC